MGKHGNSEGSFASMMNKNFNTCHQKKAKVLINLRKVGIQVGGHLRKVGGHLRKGEQVSLQASIHPGEPESKRESACFRSSFIGGVGRVAQWRAGLPLSPQFPWQQIGSGV